ncbi:hypothetical protein [Kitasatospora sp. NPDC004531]
MKRFIDATPREDLAAPAQQRHTIPRIMERPAAEPDFELDTDADVVSQEPPDPRRTLPDLSANDRLRERLLIGSDFCGRPASRGPSSRGTSTSRRTAPPPPAAGADRIVFAAP